MSRKSCVRFVRARGASHGASLAEYAVITGLISVVAIAAVYGSGRQVASLFGDSAHALAESRQIGSPEEIAEEAGLYDGIDQSDWLIGTPNADSLTLTVEPGVKGLEGPDDIRGHMGASYEQFIGGPGDDTINGFDGDNRFYFAKGDGHDLIRTSGAMAFLQFMDLRPEEMTASRIDENYKSDLILTANATGDSVRIENFAATNTANFIDGYEFPDQTMTHEQMQAKSIADQMPTGLVLGTWRDDVYPIARDSADMTIHEYDGTDTVIFEGLKADEVKFKNLENFNLQATTTDGRTYILRKGFYSDPRFVAESFVFDDATLTFQQAIDKQDVDARLTGEVFGTQYADHYLVDPLDASFSIQEYNSPSDTDTITFAGLDSTDVMFFNDADNTLTVELPAGGEVRIYDAFEFNDWAYIEEFRFDDGTLLMQDVIDKMDEDSKAQGYIHGASRGDHYTIALSDPSLTIDEWGSTTTPDEIVFEDASTAWGYSRSGDDLILEQMLRNLTIKNFYLYFDAGHIEQWKFSDKTLTYQEMLDTHP